MTRIGRALLIAGLAMLATPLAAQHAALRLRMQAIRDPMMNNEEAFRFLVPADWRVEGGVVWRLRRPHSSSRHTGLTP